MFESQISWNYKLNAPTNELWCYFQLILYHNQQILCHHTKFLLLIYSIYQNYVLAQVSCKYISSLMNYLRKKFNNLQLFLLQFSGECYIFKCVKINLFLRTKLGTFFGKIGHYSKHKIIKKNYFAICCTFDTICPGLHVLII